MAHDLPQIPTAAVALVLSLCGAVILLLLDLWLRRREVRDPALIWLYVSLFTWSFGAAGQLLPASWLAALHVQRDAIPYVLSPVSSILFTVTAFRLARVREVFRRPDMALWPAAVVGGVLLLSLAAYVSDALGYSAAGEVVDAVASCVALTALGGGLAYSFYRYGNPLLVGLTAITVTFLVSRQFLRASFGELHGVLAAAGIAGNATLIMLFIALAVAWGLSDTSRLRPVGVPAHVSVVALFFDLRGSTRWAMDALHGDFDYVGAFVDELRAWTWRNAVRVSGARPNLMKFLGDGFLMVWEVPRESQVVACASRVAQLACTLAAEYPAWAAENGELWRGVPEAMGLGMDAGPAIRLTFENGSEDYLGKPINTAARMQDLARPRGGVALPAAIADRLDGDVCAQFTRAGEVLLDARDGTPVRATAEVELPVRCALA